MPSEARQFANAANAQHSTGPRTETGKAQSSQNARKHGLTAKDLVIGPDNAEEFEDMLAEYRHDIAPQGVIEETLFDELVAAAWNLRRIRRMETELCGSTASYLDLLDDAAAQTKLERLARHKVGIERSFHRSLNELKALQTNRALAVTLPGYVRENTPQLGSATQFAKRTQALRHEMDEMGRQNPIGISDLSRPPCGRAGAPPQCSGIIGIRSRSPESALVH